MPRLSVWRQARSVVPLPKNGSSTVSPTKLNSFTHLFGNSIGNGAGCPTLFLLSPLNTQTPFVQSINSCFVISDFLLPPSFFQCFLYRITITSTGAITNGADALIHEPQAVRRDIFPSFQII